MTTECESKVCEERFVRDKERIKALEDKGDTTAALLAQAMATLERVNKQLDDHESRLRESEKRPVQWWDKLINAGITALVAAFIAWIVSR